LRAITALAYAIKLTMRGGNYCLIVNRIEKKLSRQKDLIAHQLTGIGPFQTFQSFNRFAPFNALRRFKVQ